MPLITFSKPRHPNTNMIIDPTPTNQPLITAKASGAQRFRRLKWNEVVRRGDFIKDGRDGFKPWEGPAGFRADAFVKATFRKLGLRGITAHKADEYA
jgi:hypothetical protein